MNVRKTNHGCTNTAALPQVHHTGSLQDVFKPMMKVLLSSLICTGMFLVLFLMYSHILQKDVNRAIYAELNNIDQEYAPDLDGDTEEGKKKDYPNCFGVFPNLKFKCASKSQVRLAEYSRELHLHSSRRKSFSCKRRRYYNIIILP
jgi:hypothetical protein